MAEATLEATLEATFVGKGSYGCVFKDIECIGKPDTKGEISKVWLEGDDWVDLIKARERNIQDILINYFFKKKYKNELPPDVIQHLNKYYIFNSDICNLSPETKKLINHNCHTTYDVTHTLNYPYGGMDLETYVYEQMKTPADFINILDKLMNVFRGIQYLHSAKLVHYDISLKNLVCDGNTIRIIDFDLCNYKLSESTGTFRPPNMERYFKTNTDKKAFPNADFYALREIIIEICGFADELNFSQKFIVPIYEYMMDNPWFKQTETDTPLSNDEIGLLINVFDTKVGLLKEILTSSSKQSSAKTLGGKKRTRRSGRSRRRSRRQRRTKKFIKRL